MRAFVLTQASNFAGVISGSIIFIALPWLVLDVTGSSAQGALVIAASSIPGLLLAPMMGSFIDSIGRRRVAWAAEGLTVLTTIAFPLMAVFGAINLWSLVVLAVIRNIFSPGGQSARKSLVPDVAAKAGLTLDRANSLHEAVFAAGFAVGPAISAIVIGFSGPMMAFWWSAGAGAASALFMLAVKVVEKQEPVSAGDDIKRPLRYAFEGVRALGRYPAVAILFISLLAVSLIYIPTEMVVLPRYFNDIAQPEGLGFLIATMATASVFGSLAYEWLAARISYPNLLRMVLFGISAAMLPMAFLLPQWAMLVLGAILGFSFAPVIPLLNTVVQRQVPANLRGRVFSLEMAVWNASPMISFIAVGFAVDQVGVQPVYIALAIGVALASLAISSAPQMRSLAAAKQAPQTAS
jgi:DHA3 family macrolide efflux protein-like MFS transporter